MREISEWLVVVGIICMAMIVYSLLSHGPEETMAVIGRSLRAFREGAGL